MSQNRRRNNPQNMSIIEQIEKIKGGICDSYCKYRDGLYDDKLTQDELDDICNHCPLSKL